MTDDGQPVSASGETACPSCGRAGPAGAAFCGACGASMTGAAPAVPPAPPPLYGAPGPSGGTAPAAGLPPYQGPYQSPYQGQYQGPYSGQYAGTYQSPYYAMPMAPSKPTNGMAIASMILGILWIYWLGSILALVFGYVALGQIKKRNEGGRGMAIAGVVLGWIGVVTLVLVIVVAIVAAHHNATYGN